MAFLLAALVFLMLTAACVRLPRRASTEHYPISSRDARNDSTGVVRIDINRASLEEIEGLPGIGAGLAARIIAHRARHGRFRRVEHLVMVRGISERRFEQMRPFIKALTSDR